MDVFYGSELKQLDCQIALVPCRLDLEPGQHKAGRTADAGRVVIKVQGHTILLLQLVGVNCLREILSAVIVGIEVE